MGYEIIISYSDLYKTNDHLPMKLAHDVVHLHICYLQLEINVIQLHLQSELIYSLK